MHYKLDTRDEMVLNAAANGGYPCVVTFNKWHFAEASSYGISVVCPGKFLTLLGGSDERQQSRYGCAGSSAI